MGLLRILILLTLLIIMSCKQQRTMTDETKADSLDHENLTLDKKETQKTKEPVDKEVVEEEPTVVDKIKEETPEINEIVKQIFENKDSIIVLVKLTGQNDLVRVLNKNWPEDIETTFNIFKNRHGQIIYISEFPTSESGDWNLRLEHFFSTDGHLTAFVKDFAFFNSPCLKEGVAFEQLLELYDNDFKVIGSIKCLSDNKGNPLDEEECGNAYYTVEYDKRPTAKEFMELKGIKV
jgi:hypothetical protein